MHASTFSLPRRAGLLCAGALLALPGVLTAADAVYDIPYRSVVISPIRYRNFVVW